MMNGLINLPSSDENFKIMVKKATKEELNKALTIMEASPAGNLTRILAIRKELVIREKILEKEATDPQLSMFSNEAIENIKVDVTSDSEKEVTNFMEFEAKKDEKTVIEMSDDVSADVPADIPIDVSADVSADVPIDVSADVSADVPIDVSADVSADVPADVPIDVSADVPADVPTEVSADVPADIPADVSTDTSVVDSAKKPETSFTAIDVFKKLTDEKEKFPDGDSTYVIDKLINMAVKDNDLCNAIMQEHKSYEGAFKYFFKRCREVGYTAGNCCYLDNDKAVKLAVEYFFFDEEKAEAERKAKIEAENKRRKEEAVKKKQSKRTRKKKVVEEVKADECKTVSVSLDSSDKQPVSSDAITGTINTDKAAVNDKTTSDTTTAEVLEVDSSIEDSNVLSQHIKEEKLNNYISMGDGQLSFSFC